MSNNNQETLEEAAEEYLIKKYQKGTYLGKLFTAGAKWQEDKTIEEVFEWLTTEDYLTDLKETLIKNFKEFKNKQYGNN